MQQSPSQTVAQLLADEIHLREALNPDYYNASKQISIARARAFGMSNGLIEAMFNFKLSPGDRS